MGFLLNWCWLYWGCVCVSDGKWKTTLEAGARDVDGERPAAVWQYATHERTLAQPDTHLPSARHTVHTHTQRYGCLFARSYKHTFGKPIMVYTLAKPFVHTHMQTLTLFAWQLAVLINWELKYTTAVFLSQLERNSTKALRLLKACWGCVRRQLLLQGIDLKSKFNWTAAQISL